MCPSLSLVPRLSSVSVQRTAFEPSALILSPRIMKCNEYDYVMNLIIKANLDINVKVLQVVECYALLASGRVHTQNQKHV